MKTISIIAAMGKNRAIGNAGKIPWHLPADLAHFKNITMGHPVIMGRKTYESIGRPLPDRQNIIVTNQAGYRAGGCETASSLERAIEIAHGDEVFVIGGAEIYRQSLPLANRIYLTVVDREFPADAYFPELDGKIWRETENIPVARDEKNPYSCSFLKFERVS